MSDTPISAEEARRQALELSKAMLRGECSTFGDEVPMAEAIVSYAAEVERLRTICQRIRAGWLPHRLSSGTWWWGRPSDDGFRWWAIGHVPTMSVVEAMTDQEVADWTATLHPLVPEAAALRDGDKT